MPKPQQLDLDLPARSSRRQRAAVRRTRRAAGLPSETHGERLGGRLRALVRSQATQLAGLWSLALALGTAGGVWLAQERPPGLDDRLSPGLRSQLAAARIGPPAPELAAAAPVEGAPAAVAVQAARPRPAELAGSPPSGPAPLPAPAPGAAPAVAAPAEGALAAAAPAVHGRAGAAKLADPPGSRPTWEVNAVPVALVPDRPMIAVVVDDLGLNRPATRATIALPGPLSLAFLAYADALPAQAGAARAAGHELLLHTPMEPEGSQDPGPEALLTGLPAAENLRRLTGALGRLPGVVGINNHMGSRFTASRAAMAPVLAELQRRGLLFLDSRTTAGTVGGELAGQMGVPSVSRDVFLDHDVEAGRAYVEQRLAEVETVARTHGAALAIGHPHAGTLAALRDWLPRLEARGFQLVPVSALVRARLARQLAQARDR